MEGQSCFIDPSPLICSTSQLTGFYIVGTFVFNDLSFKIKMLSNYNVDPIVLSENSISQKPFVLIFFYYDSIVLSRLQGVCTYIAWRENTKYKCIYSTLRVYRSADNSVYEGGRQVGYYCFFF